MISKKFEKMCELYKIFASHWNCDFSEEAKEYAYKQETFGGGDSSGIFSDGKKPNGYLIGKKWLNVQVTAWKKDLTDWLALPAYCRYDIVHPYDTLFQDEIFKNHHEWLKEVLGINKLCKQLRAELDKIMKDIKCS